MTVKKIVSRCTTVLCLILQLLCIISLNSKTSSYILNNEKLTNSLIFKIVNWQKGRYVLSPSRSCFAAEERRVLYAVQHDDTSFLSAKELPLYDMVKLFQEQYKDKTDIEKVFSAVVTTCYSCQYDLKAKRRDTAYSVLVRRRAVCSGYSRAVQLLLCSTGVDCLYVVNRNHAWNLVKIDGAWFHCDSTFCDRNQKILCYYNAKSTNRSERLRATLCSLDYLLMNDTYAALSRKNWNRNLYPKATTDPEQYLQYIINTYYKES